MNFETIISHRLAPVPTRVNAAQLDTVCGNTDLLVWYHTVYQFASTTVNLLVSSCGTPRFGDLLILSLDGRNFLTYFPKTINDLHAALPQSFRSSAQVLTYFEAQMGEPGVVFTRLADLFDWIAQQ